MYFQTLMLPMPFTMHLGGSMDFQLGSSRLGEVRLISTYSGKHLCVRDKNIIFSEGLMKQIGRELQSQRLGVGV
ncbi:hypothetical protein AHAS_Ahas12G0135900 [Arachis hypogaea]